MSVIPVQNSQLPGGFCPSTYQELLNGFSAVQFVTLEDTISQLVVSATKPADTTLAWLQLDSFGRPVRVYWFAQGAWLSLHPQPPGFVMPWFDPLPTFTTFDGGDVNALSPISGPMWERITTVDVRFPLSTGTLPSGAIVNQGDTGGEEKHSLTVPEIPPHTHVVNLGETTGGDDGGDTVTSGPAGAQQEIERTSDSTGGTAGVVVPHNNMPPYVGMAWLRRTSRMFYAIS